MPREPVAATEQTTAPQQRQDLNLDRLRSTSPPTQKDKGIASEHVEILPPPSARLRHGAHEKCPYGILTCRGCRRDGQQQQHQQRDVSVHARADQRKAFLLALGAAVARTPRQLWNDVRQYFIAYNFDVGVINAQKAQYFAKAWDNSNSVTVASAADALSTMNMGINNKDPRLLAEGRNKYGLALRALNDEMARPGALFHDNVLMAVFTISHLGVYSVISPPQGLGWQAHIPGFVSIFLRRGVNGFRTAPAQVLLQNSRHLILMDALLKRKATFLGESQWIAAASQNSNIAVELMNIAVRVPKALEMTDAAIAAQDDLDLVLDAFSELSKIQDELSKWLLQCYAQSTTLPYHIVDAKTFVAHVLRTGDLIGEFESALSFTSFPEATTHQYYWIILLLVQTAILDVSELADEPFLHGEKQTEILTAAVEETASNLCRSVAYLSQPQHRSFGIMASNVALHFAQAWYVKQGQERAVAWCKRIREALLQQDDFRLPLRLHQPIFIWWMLPENSMPLKQPPVRGEVIGEIEDEGSRAAPLLRSKKAISRAVRPKLESSALPMLRAAPEMVKEPAVQQQRRPAMTKEVKSQRLRKKVARSSKDRPP